MGKAANSRRNYATEQPPEQTKKHFHQKDLASIQARSDNQRSFIQSYVNTDNETFFVSGYPGTGKTFLACWLAMDDVLSADTDYEQLVIFRSAVESRKIGFLPGTEQEKAAAYEKPYHGLMDDIFKTEHKNNYNNLKENGYVDFELSSNQRGVTYSNAIMIVDECQNLTFEELDTIYTRAGSNTRVIFCGDKAQDDLVHYKGQLSGFDKFREVLEGIEDVSFHGFYNTDDIVRSGKVRRYIEEKIKLGMC